MKSLYNIIACLLLALPAFRAGAQSGVVFDTLRIDMGTLREDAEPAVCTFRWRNDTDSPVSVVMVRTTCGCLVAEYDKSPVAPGEEGIIAVTYHQKGHPGGFDRRIFVYTGLSSSSPTAVLNVTGHVEPASRPVWEYSCSIGALYLKRKQVRFTGKGRQVERIMCLNAGDSDIALTVSMGMLPDGVSFRTEPEIIAPGETGDIVIGFDPEKASGSLPSDIPLILDGIRVPPGERTVKILIQD